MISWKRYWSSHRDGIKSASRTRVGSWFQEAVVEVLWICWIVVLPFAHLTGLRNVLAVTCICATLIIFGRKPLINLPGKLAILSIFVWAALSMIWSADRAASWAHLKDDLAISFLAYAAAFTLFQSDAAATRVLKAFPIAVTALTLVSCFALLPLYTFDDWIPLRYDAALGRPMPIWYPGMGDASMFFALSVAPLILLTYIGTQRWLAVAGGVLLLAGALVIRNRVIALILPAATGCYFLIRAAFADASRKDLEVHSPTIAKYLIGFLLPILVAAPLAEVIFHQRFTLAGRTPPAWGHALIEAVKEDPRPIIWGEYLSLGMSHPFIGVGFGRTVPATAYHTKTNPTLVAADTAAFSHAHNLFIDIWLQLGLVGIGLSLWVVVELVRSTTGFARTHRSCTLIATAFLTLLFAVGLRCTTDDLLTYGMGSTFWILCGAMLGWQARIVRRFAA